MFEDEMYMKWNIKKQQRENKLTTTRKKPVKFLTFHMKWQLLILVERQSRLMICCYNKVGIVYS